MILVTIYLMPVTLTLKQTSFGAPHTEMLWKIFSFLLLQIKYKKIPSVKLYPSLCVYENSGDWLNVANSGIRSGSAGDKLFMYHVWLYTVVNIKQCLLVQIKKKNSLSNKYRNTHPTSYQLWLVCMCPWTDLGSTWIKTTQDMLV